MTTSEDDDDFLDLLRCCLRLAPLPKEGAYPDTQGKVLKIVKVNPGLPLHHVADRVRRSRPQTYRMLRALEKKGLVKQEGTAAKACWVPLV